MVLGTAGERKEDEEEVKAKNPSRLLSQHVPKKRSNKRGNCYYYYYLHSTVPAKLTGIIPYTQEEDKRTVPVRDGAPAEWVL